MATAAIPAPASPIAISISDPLSADAQAVLAFGTAACNFLCTPAGQKLLLAELALGADIESAAKKVVGGIAGAIHKLLHGG